MSDALVIVGLGGIVLMMSLVDDYYLVYWNGHAMLLYGSTPAGSPSRSRDS